MSRLLLPILILLTGCIASHHYSSKTLVSQPTRKMLLLRLKVSRDTLSHKSNVVLLGKKILDASDTKFNEKNEVKDSRLCFQNKAVTEEFHCIAHPLFKTLESSTEEGFKKHDVILDSNFILLKIKVRSEDDIINVKEKWDVNLTETELAPIHLNSIK